MPVADLPAAGERRGAGKGAGVAPEVEAQATELYLVRHGETAWNRAGRLQGSRDLPLNEVGRRQAEALAELLRPRTISAVFCSPLRRARQTAERILAGRDVPLQILPELAEMRCGAWEGLDAAERERRYPRVFEEWREDPWRAAIPDGEPLEQLHDRAGRALGAILRESAGKRVVVSGHGFLNRVILLSLLGRPRDSFWELKQANASCHVLRWDAAIPDPSSPTFPPPRVSEVLAGEYADAQG